jgi:hypothetical protein
VPCPAIEGATATATGAASGTATGTGTAVLYPICGKPPVQIITGVHLALQLVPSFDTRAPAHLEPAYVFELKGGGTTFPVPAVIDADLQRPAPPAPVPVPLGKPPTRPLPPGLPPTTVSPNAAKQGG